MSAREFCAPNKAKICMQFVSTFYKFTNKNKNEELNVGDQKTGNTDFDRISDSLLSLCLLLIISRSRLILYSLTQRADVEFEGLHLCPVSLRCIMYNYRGKFCILY